MKKFDNSGSISKNQRKEKDSHPDLKGKATVGGQEYWISGWLKDGENGKWYSLSFEPKDERSDRPNKKPSRDESDAIPF